MPINEKELITELDSIIAYCDLLKEKAAGLRKKLTLGQGSASRKRAKLSDQEVAKILAGRRAFLNKKLSKKGQ